MTRTKRVSKSRRKKVPSKRVSKKENKYKNKYKNNKIKKKKKYKKTKSIKRTIKYIWGGGSKEEESLVNYKRAVNNGIEYADFINFFDGLTEEFPSKLYKDYPPLHILKESLPGDIQTLQSYCRHFFGEKYSDLKPVPHSGMESLFCIADDKSHFIMKSPGTSEIAFNDIILELYNSIKGYTLGLCPEVLYFGIHPLINFRIFMECIEELNEFNVEEFGSSFPKNLALCFFGMKKMTDANKWLTENAGRKDKLDNAKADLMAIKGKHTDQSGYSNLLVEEDSEGNLKVFYCDMGDYDFE